jgi:AraC-like DNA-binding protein
LPYENEGVHIWSANRDPKTGYLVHSVSAKHAHSLLAPIVMFGFDALRISAAVWEHGADWFPIHVEQNVSLFEYQHGKERQRHDYNSLCLKRVLQQKTLVHGEHAGFSDLFIPVVAAGRVVAVLVTGPFARARSTSSDIQDRWHWLSRRVGHPLDPEFARYVAATLSTLVLEGDDVHAFKRLASCAARLMAGTGSAEEIANEWERLRTQLERLRLVEKTWDAVREMVDERSARGWTSTTHSYALAQLGLSRLPEGVLVALTSARRHDRDPVEEIIVRDAFQRRAVNWARAGHAVAGRVGNHGVVLLLESHGSPLRRNRRMRELAQRVTALARHEFGFALHCGGAEATRSLPLDRAYQAALAAAQAALVDRAAMTMARTQPDNHADSLRHLRRELARDLDERPDVLHARFDRYMEAAAAHCGYRLEPMRTHLEVGFERASESLLDSGALDEKGLALMRSSLVRSSSGARTAEDLVDAYRNAVADLLSATRNPVGARHERSLRTAVDYIHQHFTEPLPLRKIALMAGFSPTYFSKLFRHRESTTFERYVCRMRLDRAKELLGSTNLDAARVARLAGFNSAPYFSRAFHRAFGVSPVAYRRSLRKDGN